MCMGEEGCRRRAAVWSGVSKAHKSSRASQSLEQNEFALRQQMLQCAARVLTPRASIPPSPWYCCGCREWLKRLMCVGRRAVAAGISQAHRNPKSCSLECLVPRLNHALKVTFRLFAGVRQPHRDVYFSEKHKSLAVRWVAAGITCSQPTQTDHARPADEFRLFSMI